MKVKVLHTGIKVLSLVVYITIPSLKEWVISVRLQANVRGMFHTITEVELSPLNINNAIKHGLQQITGCGSELHPNR